MRLSPDHLVSAGHRTVDRQSSPNGAAVEVCGFRLVRRGRFWQVFDPQERLIVTAVYKKGGMEVIRRLLPPDLRPLADGLRKQRAPAPKLTRTAYNPHRT